MTDLLPQDVVFDCACDVEKLLVVLFLLLFTRRRFADRTSILMFDLDCWHLDNISSGWVLCGRGLFILYGYGL